MVDSADFGYDKTRFPKLSSENDESFDCVICSEVVRNPKECTGCGGLFCASCINSWLTKKKECPNRCDLQRESIRAVGKALLKMYNDLDIKCIHHEKCNKVVKLIDLDPHEKTCQQPKCPNFELCANFIKPELKQEACSPQCFLILKLKNAGGDWKIIHKELKEFLEPYMSKSAISNQPNLNKNVEVSVTFGSGGMGGVSGGSPIVFKWDNAHCGTNIQLSENGTVAYLKENSYIFKSVIGTQGFTGGVHYWEIHGDSRTENELKIGVTTKKEFDANSAFCDFEFGYAYYGLGQLRHGSNANGTAYGKKFKKEGVLGICLDMNKGILSFALDGQYFGPAYTNEALKKGPIYPAVALLHCAACKLVSGKPVPQYFLK